MKINELSHELLHHPAKADVYLVATENGMKTVKNIRGLSYFPHGMNPQVYILADVVNLYRSNVASAYAAIPMFLT